MTMEALKDAITQLPAPERRHLAQWFDELQEDEWDRQIERDFSPGGRAAHLAERIDRQIEAGEGTSLDEGLRIRREQRNRK